MKVMLIVIWIVLGIIIVVLSCVVAYCYKIREIELKVHGDYGFLGS